MIFLFFQIYLTVIFVISCFTSETVGQWQDFSEYHPIYYPELGNYFQSQINSAPYPGIANTGYNSHLHAISLPLNPDTGEFSLGNEGENNRRPPYFSVSLFTPNTIDQPAETKGQIEAYNKDLEEQAREFNRERNGMTSDVGGSMNNADSNPMESMENSEHYVNFNHRDFSYTYSL